MSELRNIIGNNLSSLRKNKKLTQLELADKLGYSDKAISKWENGDTLPDIETLYQLCNFYHVTLDFLVDEKGLENKNLYEKKDDKSTLGNKISIAALLDSIVWIIATIIYVYLLLFSKTNFWQVFIWAVSLTSLFTIFINKIYFKNKICAFTCMTIFVWSLITSFYLTFLTYNIWPLFLVCIPIQIALILWLGIKTNK